MIEPAIQFQLKLPTTTYSGRYLQIGCGGYCGVIPDLPFPDGGANAPGDVAIAGTDNGHVGQGQFPFLDTEWARHNRHARDDLLYRAPHVLSPALAQRYPHDFDGTIASAPARAMGPLDGTYLAWIAQANVRPDMTTPVGSC
nr:tannase/feruloyl esterase family alpha/beta hydrolase [Kribbella capetownensis]